MANVSPQIIQDFSGGINASRTEDTIADNEMVDCLNFHLAEDKTLFSRGEEAVYNSQLTGGGRITSIFYAQVSSEAQSDFLVTTANKVYRDDGVGGWTDITGAAVLPNNTLWSWRVFNNLAIGVNGDTVPQKYGFSGNIADLGGTPPDACQDIEIYMGRVILSKDADEPTAIHGCAADNSEDWTTSGDAFTIYVDRNNGYGVMACRKFFSDLIVLKKKGIYRLQNPDNDPLNFVLTQLFDDIGCVAQHSVWQIGNELVWLDTDGVYTLQTVQQYGDVKYIAISRKIQPYIQDISNDYIQDSYAHDHSPFNEYLLAVPKTASVVNDHILVRDYYHGCWLRHNGYSPSCYGRVKLSTGYSHFFGTSDGYIYKMATVPVK